MNKNKNNFTNTKIINKDVIDICKIVEKCSIDEISKYLIKIIKKKVFQIFLLNNKFMKKLNIAIIGLGNIGSYLYKYLNKNKKILSKKNNCTPNIIYVSARNQKKKRGLKIKKNKWLKSYLEATKIKEVDLIIELIGGAEGPAKKLVFNALKNKKHVVTANKALIAKYGDQLSKIAEKNKVNLEFEASVCGGVPVIRSIKEGLIANKINKIYGIFNGTSNYILSSWIRINKIF